MMTASPEMLLLERQYRRALHRVAFRLLLIVSIALMAQLATHWPFG